MEQKPHPISLENLLFTRSSVIAVPGHLPTEAKLVLPQNNIQVEKLDGEPGRYQAAMRTQVNLEMDKAYPYCIDMECLATITADDSLTEDEALRGVAITANSVLFGAIREAVAWLTGRQPYGPLMFGLSVLRSAPPGDDAIPQSDRA